MAYTPSTAINSSRDFRNQYLRKSFSVWVQKLKAGYQKRHELAEPLVLCANAIEPAVNQRETTDQVRSEQSFEVNNGECETVLSRNAA